MTLLKPSSLCHQTTSFCFPHIKIKKRKETLKIVFCKLRFFFRLTKLPTVAFFLVIHPQRLRRTLTKKNSHFWSQIKNIHVPHTTTYVNAKELLFKIFHLHFRKSCFLPKSISQLRTYLCEVNTVLVMLFISCAAGYELVLIRFDRPVCVHFN